MTRGYEDNRFRQVSIPSPCEDRTRVQIISS